MRTTVKQTIFTSAQTSCRKMIACQFGSTVFVTVIQNRPVIAGEDNQCLFQQAFFLQVGKQFADTPVCLNDGIATRPHRCFAHKALVGSTRYVRFVQAIIQEERSIFVFSHKVLYLIYKIVGHILVFPTGFLSAFHISDTGNSVYYRVIVSVCPLHFQHLRMRDGSRFALKIMLVTHFDGIGRIESYYIAVFHVNRRDTVVGCCNQARVVETDFFGTRFDGFVPVDIAVSHPQMPLSDSSGHITALLHHLRQGKLIFINDKRSISRQDFCIFIFPRIHSGHQSVTAGSGSCRSGISVRETNSAMSQTVDIRSMNRSRAVSADITKSQIIGKNHNHIRLFFYVL